jgi:hypothetical protein
MQWSELFKPASWIAFFPFQFSECIDDFEYLWFEDEAVVAGSANWVVAGNAADAIMKESK